MGVVASFYQNRQLILRMAKHDVIGRYRGSLLGIFWSFFNPLIMLAVYSFVFGLVFKAKWGSDTGESFTLILFSGLIFHALLAECLTKAPELIINNVSYVKKVVFPLEVLPWVSVLSAFFHFSISLVILFLAKLLLSGSVPLTWLYLPMVFMPLVFVCLGVSWLFASLGVYVRDVAQLTAILATILLFLCPIFYPIEVIPEAYRPYILLNPLSFIVEQSRAILVFGKVPAVAGLLIYTAGAYIFSILAFSWFSKTKRGFADVL